MEHAQILTLLNFSHFHELHCTLVAIEAQRVNLHHVLKHTSCSTELFTFPWVAGFMLCGPAHLSMRCFAKLLTFPWGAGFMFCWNSHHTMRCMFHALLNFSPSHEVHASCFAELLTFPGGGCFMLYWTSNLSMRCMLHALLIFSHFHEPLILRHPWNCV